MSQPKKKPLRSKRGRRAPDFLQDLPEIAAGMSQNEDSAPASFNHSVNGHAPHSNASAARPPRNAFEVFANSMRSVLLVANRQKAREGEYDVERDMTEKWRNLRPEVQEDYQRRFTDGDYGEEAEKEDAKRLAEADNSDADAAEKEHTQDVKMEDSG